MSRIYYLLYKLIKPLYQNTSERILTHLFSSDNKIIEGKTWVHNTLNEYNKIN